MKTRILLLVLAALAAPGAFAQQAPFNRLSPDVFEVYRNLAERRRQMGEGARTHCDLVVKVDEPGQRIYTIGGNVRGSVSMKLLPAVREQGKPLRPTDQPMLGRRRPVFAHLKLRAKPIEANALDNSPTIRALQRR